MVDVSCIGTEVIKMNVEVVKYCEYPFVRVGLVFAGFERIPFRKGLLLICPVNVGYNCNDVIGWNVLCGRWSHG